MGIIENIEELAGVLNDDELICVKCATDEDLAEAKSDDLIYIREIENAYNKLYICNRHKGRL